MRGTKVVMASNPFDPPVGRACGATRLSGTSMRLCTGADIFAVCAKAGAGAPTSMPCPVAGVATRLSHQDKTGAPHSVVAP